MVEGVDVACEGKAEARLRDPDAEHSEHSENEAVSVLCIQICVFVAPT